MALSLPLVCLVLLGVVQVAVVVRDQLLVDHLAREAARAAAVSAEPAGAARAAIAASGVPGPEATIDVDGRVVRVQVRLTNRTDVALIGLLLPDVTLRGTATMQREPP